MKNINVNLKVITPLFLHGADGKTPEIRPASIKGIIRYWWRAARSENDIDNLRKIESSIFGGAGEDYGRSPVTLRVSSNARPGYNYYFDDYKNPGLRYLFYSFFLGDNRACGYFDADTDFKLRLSTVDNKSDKLRQAASALWLAVYFGGFGMRSRRGAGNLSAYYIEDESKIISDDIDFIPKNINNATDLKDWLLRNYKSASSIICDCGGTMKYSNLHGARLIIIEPAKSSWNECLNYIGEKYMDFRRDKSKLSQRAPMGLPITGVRIISKDSYNRSASRLFLKVLKINDLYFSYILSLKGEILPRNCKIEVKGKELNIPDDSIITRFIDSIKEKAEVTL